MPKTKLKILFVAAESVPFVKVGGLADVVGSLPPALKKLGTDVRVIIPKYGFIEKKNHKIKKIISGIKIASGKNMEKVNVWQGVIPDQKVKVYFIENRKFFQSKKVYLNGEKNIKNISDEERFLFFSLASLKVLSYLKFKPDIIHAHDYHTSLVTDLVKTSGNYLKDIKTVLTIHNLNYQGRADLNILKISNLSPNSLESLSVDVLDGNINFMFQGILNADLITTVSPTYAKEIMTSKYGAGLEKIIRKRKKDVYGIINGLDVNFFNPQKDKFIKKRYSVKTLNKKVENKIFLQKKLGLPQDKNIALVGLVSRLAWQKGIELIKEDFGKLDCQFVFLGTGQKEYENYLKRMAKKYPKKVSANIMFDIKLANQIYAAADIFLMPSRFEPCGLGQMIAMRYGAVPVVRGTGGLKDTVIKFDGRNKKSTGFVFEKFSSQALYRELKRSLKVYYNDKKIWKKIIQTGMKQDFSWKASAKKYLKLYQKLKIDK